MYEHIKTNSPKAWILAARPKTLTGAAVPVMAGCGLAVADNVFSPTPAALCLIFAFLMQIDANLINDYFDYIKGSDREDRLGPQRACQEGWITLSAMKRGIIATTLLSAIEGSMLLLFGGWELIIIGALCMLGAFLYTAGPRPLSYEGLGDLMVIIFFGLISVETTYYIMSGNLTWYATMAALATGFATDALLIINNFRDHDQDVISGKKTIVVRLGRENGARLYLITGIIAAMLCIPLVLRGQLWAALLPQLYLWPHFTTWKRMIAINNGRELNSVLGSTARNILIFGILLTLGLMM